MNNDSNKIAHNIVKMVTEEPVTLHFRHSGNEYKFDYYKKERTQGTGRDLRTFQDYYINMKSEDPEMDEKDLRLFSYSNDGNTTLHIVGSELLSQVMLHIERYEGKNKEK